MIILPSGRITGITNERARFHATRRKIRVTRHTPLSQLYKLVDVICFNHQNGEENDNSIMLDVTPINKTKFQVDLGEYPYSTSSQ